eukprot:g576.t1
MERGQISLQVVREYLQKKGYHETLQELDRHSPIIETREIVVSSEKLQRAEEKFAHPTAIENMADWVRKNSSSSSSSSSGRPWSSDEKERLRRAVRKYTSSLEKSERWRKISKYVETRGKRECYDFYKSLKDSNEHDVPTSGRERDVRQGAGRTHGHVEELALDDVDIEQEFSNAPAKEEENDALAFDFSGFTGFSEGEGAGAKAPDSSLINEALSSVYSGEAPRQQRSRPITEREARELRDLLFGKSTRANFFNDAWLKQGFFFDSNHPALSFGLIQRQGGPCGAIAAVQAHVIMELLFRDNAGRGDSGNMAIPTFQPKEQARALLESLVSILWRAGNGSAIVALPTSRGRIFGSMEGYRTDGFTEKIVLKVCETEDDLRATIAANFPSFTDPEGFGVAALTYSAIFSRGLDNVVSDRDEEISLIDRHNYASQSLVNLLLVGKAVNQAFDGEREFGGMLLRGISSQSSVGYLTLFEHYGQTPVGQNYKQPLFPIYVICSESHYSVLFCKDQGVAQSSGSEGSAFDIFYYDELGMQDELYRLTVTPGAGETGDKNLEPPINNVLRTRWPGARISWNGSEELL